DAAVLHPLRDVAEGHVAAVVVALLEGDVVGDADAVPEPLGASVDEGGADAVDAVRLAGVHRDGQALAVQELEGVAESGWQEPAFGSGDVEPDDPAVAVAQREFGDLAVTVVLPHRGDELAGADPSAVALDARDGLVDARLHRFDG